MSPQHACHQKLVSFLRQVKFEKKKYTMSFKQHSRGNCASGFKPDPQASGAACPKPAPDTVNPRASNSDLYKVETLHQRKSWHRAELNCQSVLLHHCYSHQNITSEQFSLENKVPHQTAKLLAKSYLLCENMPSTAAHTQLQKPGCRV